jgi:hypothetical protein
MAGHLVSLENKDETPRLMEDMEGTSRAWVEAVAQARVKVVENRMMTSMIGRRSN